MTTAPLWRPSPGRVAAARLTAFARHVSSSTGRDLTTYDDLYRYSLDEPGGFWSAIWDFCGVVAAAKGDVAVIETGRMPGARFFPDARPNFAENLLRHADDRLALVFRPEGGGRETWTRAELYDEVSRLVQVFQKWASGRATASPRTCPTCRRPSLTAASTTTRTSHASPACGVTATTRS